MQAVGGVALTVALIAAVRVFARQKDSHNSVELKKEVIERIRAYEKKGETLIVVDLYNTLLAGYYGAFFLDGDHQIIVITSKIDMPGYLESFKKTTLDKVGGTSLSPEVNVSDIVVIYGLNSNELLVKQMLESEKSYTLWIGERKISLPNNGDGALLTGREAAFVLDCGLGLCSLV